MKVTNLNNKCCNGYFIIAREILDHWVFCHPITLKIFIWLLAKASFKDQNVFLKIGKGYTTVELKPGELIYGRNKAEEKLQINGGTIDNHLRKLIQENIIARKINSHYSIITVLNYDYYQAQDNYFYQANDKQLSSKYQAIDTNKKSKTIKKFKNDDKKNSKNLDRRYNPENRNRYKVKQQKSFTL